MEEMVQCLKSELTEHEIKLKWISEKLEAVLTKNEESTGQTTRLRSPLAKSEERESSALVSYQARLATCEEELEGLADMLRSSRMVSEIQSDEFWAEVNAKNAESATARSALNEIRPHLLRSEKLSEERFASVGKLIRCAGRVRPGLAAPATALAGCVWMGAWRLGSGGVRMEVRRWVVGSYQHELVRVA